MTPNSLIRSPRLVRRIAAVSIALGFAALAAASPAHAGISPSSPDAAARGQWTAKRDDRPNLIWFGFQSTLSHGGWNQNWDGMPIAQLKGLSPDAINGPTSDVAFDIVRDAGTLRCHGEFSDGIGAGLFDLVLDSRYADQLEKRGVGRPTRDQQVRLALADASYELLDVLAAQKYPTPDVDMFLKMTQHGVDVEYIQGMAKLGYKFGTVSELIKARDHGVDPEFVRRMADAGYSKLDFDVLLRARDHGADPEYIGDMGELGFKKLPLEDLIRARDHGVDADYVEGMNRAGYPNLSLATLIRARDHGVSPNYAKRMKENRAGVTIEEVISMRDRGVHD